MRSLLKLPIVLVVFLFGASLASAAGCGPNQICSCGNISFPGNYSVAGPLLGAPISVAPLAGSACIFINSSNVDLDCQGNPILNDVAGTTYGIIVENPQIPQLTNVSIHSCPSVSNYTYGVAVYGANDSLITNNTAFNNTNGFFLSSTEDLRFNSNDAHDNLNNGVWLEASVFDNITSDNASNNGVYGFSATNSNNDRFDSDFAQNNGAGGNWAGFYFGLVSGNNTVVNNYALNNSYYGFAFDTNFNILKNNTAENNSEHGFYLYGAASNNNLTSNNATGNLLSGFWDTNSAVNNTFISNTADYNLGLGINAGFYLGFTAGFNTLLNNSASNNSGDGYSLDTTENLLENNMAVNNNESGFYLFGLASGNNLSVNHALGNNANGFYLNHVSYNSLSNNNATGNLEDGYYILSTSVASYNNITGSTAVNNYNGYELLDEDHALLAFDNAFNNSNDGYFLHGTSPGSQDNSLYNDNASFNGNNGFELGSSSDCCSPFTNFNFLNQDIAHDNSNNGFNIDTYASYNVINNSLAYNQNYSGESNDAGFYVEGCNLDCSYNNITNSEAYNDRKGFELNDEDHDYLADNKAHDNYFAGFELDYGSVSNVLVGNTAYNDTNRFGFSCPSSLSGGFVLYSAVNNTINDSQSYDNYAIGCVDVVSGPPVGSGFVLTDEGYPSSYDNSINGANTYGNGYAGVYETESQSNGLSTDNNFTDIQTSGNTFGVYLYQDDSDHLDNITAFSNNVSGFYESGYSSNNNANINNSWFYNNPWEIIQQSSNDLEFVVNNTRLGQTPYVKFFLDDYVLGGGYEIKETTVPGALPSGMSSFGGKYLKVNFTGEDAIDEIGYIWSQAEASAGGITNSSKIGVYTWNDSGWNLTAPQTMDLSNSSMYTITTGSYSSGALVNITSDDIYALFYNGTILVPPSSGGNPPVNNGYLVMSKQAVCPGNLLNVTVSTSGNSPAAGASVTVYENGVPVAAGSTGPDGSVSLTLNKTDNRYTVNATYGSYPAIGQGFSYALCAGTPACSSDNDCPVDQRCQVNDNPSLNKCVPVQCQCGQSVQNHTCVGQVYQCGSGQNCNACPNGQICGDNHQCKPGCTSDASCKDNEACRTATGAPGTTTTPGACQPLCPDGSSSCSCGQATNHTLVPYGYECGSEPGCQQCQPGFTCNSDHKCVQGDINCPPTAVVGDQKNCNVTQNNQPLSNCSVTVSDPTGKTYTESCDPSGNLQTPPLTIQGVWTVTLLQNGTAVKTVQINALPKSAPAEQPTPTAAPGFDLGSLVWLLVLLVIIIAAILYWRSRGGKRS